METEIQVKTENTQDADTQVTENKSQLTTFTPNRTTNASSNKRTGHKDYNSRYTSKYSHGMYLWTEQRIYDLIRLYKEYTAVNKVCVRYQKPMWESIASKMRELGHTKCTDNHCYTKYRTLIRQYRVICDRSGASESRHLDFPYYEAISEVYDYTGSNNTEADDMDSEEVEDSSADNKLASLLVIINKDKKEQDKKRLEKLESMHREKMDMFSSFLKTVSKKPSESLTPTRTSKRLSASTRKRSMVRNDDDYDYNMDSSDSSVDSESEKKSPNKRMKNSDSKSNSVASLIRKMNEERKTRDERKMCRLEKMHEEKMKMFSSFLDVIKKMKK